MSTPATEVKAPVPAETLGLEQRIRALEVDAKTWYEKHLPLIAAIAGVIVGGLLGHFVKV